MHFGDDIFTPAPNDIPIVDSPDCPSGKAYAYPDAADALAQPAPKAPAPIQAGLLSGKNALLFGAAAIGYLLFFRK